jgi:hypothetical protein
MGFLDLDAGIGTKQVLSADSVFFYERASRSWRFYTVSKSTLYLPSCLWVNDGIETGGMQCSDCVSMLGLQYGRDSCHIGREILTLEPCLRIFPYPLPISPPK